MSKKIYAPLSEDFVRLMRNWARARAGLLASLGLAMSSIYDGPIRIDRNPEPRIPVLEGDAQNVSEALMRVPARYRQAVELFWDMEGASLRQLARRCGKEGVNYFTFESWVIIGHERLREALDRSNALCAAKRLESQSLGAGA